jgi:hypothetical protein
MPMAAIASRLFSTERRFLNLMCMFAIGWRNPGLKPTSSKIR